MKKATHNYHCYVLNLTNMSVTVGDLRITIPPRATKDILDCRHSNLDVEQVRKSIESGSLFRREDQKILKVLTHKPNPQVVHKQQEIAPPRIGLYRSSVTIEQKRFKELEIDSNDDDILQYAINNADSVLDEHKPIIDVNKSTDTKE